MFHGFLLNIFPQVLSTYLFSGVVIMEELSDIKRQNLIRLAKERRVEEPSKLAMTLGVSIQHASQLLLGKANIGDKTVQRLCSIWNIDPGEFVVGAQNSFKGGSEPKLEDWSLKQLLEQISKRMDEQQETNRNIVKTVSRMKDDVEACRDMIKSGTEAIVDLNKRMGNIRKAMDEAAQTGSFEPLGGVAVNDK